MSTGTTSQKQIAANRANAQKSTGPRTAAGKAKSRLNGVRDGLTGQVTTLSGEERPVFEKILAEHLAALAPMTFDERKLAHAIAWDTWRLDRLRATEMNIFSIAAEIPDDVDSDAADGDACLHTARSNADTFRAEAARLELMSLYESRMSRSLHRNRTALRELQTERRRNLECDRNEEILLARFQDLKDLPYQAPLAPSANGFTFSNDEIAAAATRQRLMEGAAHMLNNLPPYAKFGVGEDGTRDLFAEMPYRQPPACIGPKIHGISPESIAIRKITHPEEFRKSRR